MHRLGFKWRVVDNLVVISIPMHNKVHLFLCLYSKETFNGATLFVNVQVIPAFEEAVSGMALGGVRRCCIGFSQTNSLCYILSD